MRNLEGAMVSTDGENNISLSISWLPPEEDDMYHASLYYHLTLTPFGNTTHYFTVFPEKVSH